MIKRLREIYEIHESLFIMRKILLPALKISFIMRLPGGMAENMKVTLQVHLWKKGHLL